MRYIKITSSNGYCGCDCQDYLALPDNISDREIDEIAQEVAIGNAESYEYCHVGWDTSHKSDEELEEELGDYYENYVSGSWELITEQQYKEEC